MKFSGKIGNMKNNSVVMVVLNPFSHDARVLREAKFLVNEGYNLTVIALHEEGLKRNELKKGINVIRISLQTKKWSRHPAVQFIKYIEFLIRCMLHIIRIQPNILHCHDLNALPAGVLSKLISLGRIKLIYDSHELWSDPSHKYQQSGWLFSIGIFFEKQLIKFVDRIIMTSDGHAMILQRNYTITRPLIVRNIPEKPFILENKGLLKDEVIPKNSKIIVYVGVITQGRGLISLLHAMTRITPKTILVILGYGILKQDIQKLIVKLNLSGRVFMPSPVSPDQVIQAISFADVGVAPIENTCQSYFYSLPNKVSEYLLAGLPIAVSNFPDMARIVNEYQVGEVFDPEDPGDIATAINKILNSKEKYAALKRNVKKFAMNNHWEIEVKKLLDLYKSFSS